MSCMGLSPINAGDGVVERSSGGRKRELVNYKGSHSKEVRSTRKMEVLLPRVGPFDRVLSRQDT